MKHSISYHNLSSDTFAGTNDLICQNRERLTQYIDSLFWWNNKINLFSRDVSRETIMEHIRHSLLLSSIDTFKTSELIVDAGTGGGLPGIPLAITHQEKKLVLNDVVAKKIMALKQMGRKLSLENTSTVDKSIKDLSVGDDFLLVSKHAFKLNDLYQMTAHLPWTAMALYKSTHFKEELEDIDIPLQINVYKLYPNSDEHSFYKGKGILIIKR